jgi:ATP-dependent protease HslVU (ClpYQ) peptidase subunit
VSGAHEQIIGRPKINKKGEFLIGGAGSLRSLQVMFYSTKLPNKINGEDSYHYFVNTVVSCYRKSLKEQGFLRVKEGLEKTNTGYIIAYRGCIYHIAIDFAVDQKNDYFSIGSGSYYALGSLHATNSGKLSAEDRIILALDAASEFDSYVRPPYEIICMEWKGHDDGDEYIFYDSDGSIKNGFLEDDYLEEEKEFQGNIIGE